MLGACNALQRLHGFSVTTLDVDATGRVDSADLEAAVRDDTVLVTIMPANNETGTLQSIAELAAIAHRKQVCSTPTRPNRRGRCRPASRISAPT